MAAAEVQVRDHVLWISHIRGDEALAAWLMTVPAGALIDLEIEGVRGSWTKMVDGKDGRPTPGFRPLAAAERRWGALQDQRGQWLPIRLCEDH